MLDIESIEAIESARGSRVLLFASTHLDIDMLAPLYESLAALGSCERLDVLFYSRGGAVNAARRIALLFHEFCEHLSFLVPHYCESAGTLTALSGHEIIAGPLAIFSPIDPILPAADGGSGGPHAVSSQDLRLFSEMCERWFGLEPLPAKAEALKALVSSIFPTTLTSFYRSTLETEAICKELLQRHIGDDRETLRDSIARKLIFGFHSHTFALTGQDLCALGLPVTSQQAVEAPMWQLACHLRGTIGPGARNAAEETWMDAVIATRHGAIARQRSENMPGQWSAWE